MAVTVQAAQQLICMALVGVDNMALVYTPKGTWTCRRTRQRPQRPSCK